MKKTIILLLNVMIISLSYSCNAQSTKESGSDALSKGDKVAVYYFHYTKRCVTCKAVEEESKKAVQDLYPEAYNKGMIAFHSLNLEEEKGKSTAEKFTVSGQTLLIVKDDKTVNLTNEGFMYARSNPEKFRKAIQEAIGEL